MAATSSAAASTTNTRAAPPPGHAPSAASVLPKARTENFTVASLLLPRVERRALMGIYGFARIVDDAGDEARGDRRTLRESRGRARAPRFPPRDARACSPLRRRLHGAAAGGALAGRRRGLPAGPDLPPARGHGALRRQGAGPRARRALSGAAGAPRFRGRSRARAPAYGRRSHPQSLGRRARRHRRLRRRRPRRAGRGRGVGFLRPDVDAEGVADGAPSRYRERSARGGAMTMSSTEWGYAYCQAVTRREAGNFYYGIRLLPARRRAALCAIYALARRVDDIGDGTAPRAEKLRQLEEERRRLASVQTAYDDPVLVAVADAAARYPIPVEAFDDLIDGVEMDVLDTSYDTFSDLLPYCRRVAGAIGRLSLGVFETAEREAAAIYADDLGVAFQLRNILRDIREDLARGRIYIPTEDLERFRCDLGAPDAGVADLICFEADRARAWFDAGLRLLPLLDRQSAACVSAMAEIYRRLLARIERRPDLVLRRRISVP